MLPIEDHMERTDVSKLHDVIQESIQSVSEATHLDTQEVVGLLEKVRVDRVSEVKSAISELGGYETVSEPLSSGIEMVIHTISIATDLDTDSITEILTERDDAEFDDLVFRLREKSRSNRWNLGAV